MTSAFFGMRVLKYLARKVSHDIKFVSSINLDAILGRTSTNVA